MVDLELICIGNELLIGKVENTNAFWLAKQATLLGVNVKRVTVIPDIVEEIAKTILEAAERKPDFIITTGGLGPTFDDKTLEGVAGALNCKLEVNQKALEMVKDRCQTWAKKRNLPAIEMTPPRVKMANLPKKAEMVNNPVGTAPAVRAKLKGSVLIVLPGVPREMEAIFNETIAPLLRQASGSVNFFEKSLFVQGITEATLAPLIDRVMLDNQGVYIKSHPVNAENKPHIELHLTMIAKDELNPAEKLSNAVQQLSCLIAQKGGKTV